MLFLTTYLGMYGHLRSHIAAVLYARRTVRHPTSLRRLRQTLDVVGRLLRHDGRSILGGMAAKTKPTKRSKSSKKAAYQVTAPRPWYPIRRGRENESNEKSKMASMGLVVVGVAVLLVADWLKRRGAMPGFRRCPCCGIPVPAGRRVCPHCSCALGKS